MVNTSPDPECHNYPRRMPRAIFLDSGGVINDNDRRAPQWMHHLEQYMPTTCLGGPGKLWGKANAVLSDRLFRVDSGLWEKLISDTTDFQDFHRAYHLYWIQESVKIVNELLRLEYEQNAPHDEGEGEGRDGNNERKPMLQLLLPETEEEQIEIAHNAHLYCTALVQADYPGAVDAILKLKLEQGFELYTCSGEASTELELTFRTLGISILDSSTPTRTQDGSRCLQPVFTKLYGPDLINCHKGSSRFYKQIFQDSGIDPRDVVVVDDKEHILAWAKVHGARTVMISNKDRSGKEMTIEVEELDGVGGVLKRKTLTVVDHQLRSLAELPDLTAEWQRHLANNMNNEV
ncbi:hypothetical protein BGX28_008354 [Mortierella sp. GBA30]|nr:hypothetical protein BGX28_008354 [Mortierella sp. GBA30]